MKRRSHTAIGVFVAGLFSVCLGLGFVHAPSWASSHSAAPPAEGRPIPNEQQLQLIWDFVQIAFSPVLWMETVEDQLFLLRAYAGYERGLQSLKEGSWFTALARDTYSPAPLGVINKWTLEEIPVVIGWPAPVEGLFRHSPEDKATQDIVAIARDVTDMIAKASGLRLRFVDPAAPKEGGSIEYQGIHIVPVSQTGLYNQYKSYIVDASYTRHPQVVVPQTLLKNAVEFSPYARSQVDGFFVPNHKNEIQFAACRILSGLNADMQTALISECILRSLGLPSTVSYFRGLPYKRETAIEKWQQTRRSFFLGHWNEDKDKISKTIFYEGERAIAFKIAESSLMPEDTVGANDRENVPAFMLENVRARSVTDRDIQILRMLYCEDIKAGDSQKMVMALLMSSDKCY